MRKVGDKVKNREWEDMEKEFGTTEGCINCKSGFISDMKKYCSKVATIKEVKHMNRYDSGKVTEYDIYKVDLDGGQYWWSDDMFEKGEKNNAVSQDVVSHPSHYANGKIEVIDFIQGKNLNFAKGNIVKYVVRSGHKPEGNLQKELEDLKKARQYCDFAIREVKSRIKNEGAV